MEKSVILSLIIGAILAMPIAAFAIEEEEQIGFVFVNIKWPGQEIRKDITVEVLDQRHDRTVDIRIIQNIKAQFAPERRQSVLTESEFEALARNVSSCVLARSPRD